MIRKLAIMCTAIVLAACGKSEKERQRIPDDTYRPSGFHAFITHGEGNIPVSLVKADSLYHLFYTTGSDEWGHLTSKDILSWKPGVSFPIDDHGFGAVVWDENNLSGLNAKWNVIWSDGDELYLSYSQDGLNWTELEGNPILTAKGNPSVTWSADLEQWVMTITKSNEISIHWSQNLLEWNTGSTIPVNNNPQTASLFSLEGQWVLMTQGEHLTYQLGTFDGINFSSTTDWIKFNDLKTSVGAFMQNESQNIVIGKNPSLDEQLPTFTSPLSLSFFNDELRLLPSPTFESQLAGKRRAKLSKLLTDGPSWFQFIIEPSFEELEIKVADNTSDLRIKWNTSSNKITFGGTALSQEQEKESTIELNGPISNLAVDILIDHSSVDLFLNNGAYATSILALPDTFFSQVEIFLDGKKYDARAVLLDIGV